MVRQLHWTKCMWLPSCMQQRPWAAHVDLPTSTARGAAAPTHALLGMHSSSGGTCCGPQTRGPPRQRSSSCCTAATRAGLAYTHVGGALRRGDSRAASIVLPHLQACTRLACNQGSSGATWNTVCQEHGRQTPKQMVHQLLKDTAAAPQGMHVHGLT
jgi:hypothetical protein